MVPMFPSWRTLARAFHGTNGGKQRTKRERLPLALERLEERVLLAPVTVGFALTSSAGGEGTKIGSLAVTLSAASAKPVSVAYAVTGGTAANGGVDLSL